VAVPLLAWMDVPVGQSCRSDSENKKALLSARKCCSPRTWTLFDTLLLSQAGEPGKSSSGGGSLQGLVRLRTVFHGRRDGSISEWQNRTVEGHTEGEKYAVLCAGPIDGLVDGSCSQFME
jgi:hypothetical protein